MNRFAGPDPLLGTEIAGYRVESSLGRGGMGVVYLAHDLRLQRRVAFKVLAPDLAANEDFRRRFVRESRIAAAIDHPNIIPIYGAGEADGRLWIAMRYVEGEDLRSLLQLEGALTLDAATSIVAQVARALDAAHLRGLIHRDVKPANILIMPRDSGDVDGHVYLSDFGLTKRKSEDSSITSTGQFLGSIDYAAPEQIRGEEVDGRADGYSLACMFFECLTAQSPFARATDVATLYAHLSEPPPSLVALRPDLPPGLDGVLARALAKDRDERYPLCGLFVMAIREATTVATPSNLPGPSASSRFVGQRTAPNVPQSEPAVEGPSAGARTVVTPQARDAFDTDTDGHEAGRTRVGSPSEDVGGGSRRPRRRLLVTVGAAGVVLATILIVTFVLRSIGREPVREGTSAALSGRAATVRGSRDIWSIGIDGTDPVDVTRSPATDDFAPAWSPDGQRMVFVSVRQGNADIYMADVNGGRQVDLTRDPAKDTEPTWSPDGTRIAFVSDRRAGLPQIFVMDANGDEVRAITHDAAVHSAPTWSPDGREILFVSNASGRRQIYTTDSLGEGPPRPLLTTPTNDDAAVWSPRGHLVVFVRNDRDGNGDIWVTDPTRPQPRRLTSNSAADYAPGWCGQDQIVFISNRSNGLGIYLMTTDGHHQVKITPEAGVYQTPHCSPNGRRILYAHASVADSDGAASPTP